MKLRAEKNNEEKPSQAAEATAQKKSVNTHSPFIDNRAETILQLKLYEMANSSLQAKHAAELQSMADNYATQKHAPAQKKGNQTGIPDNLKTGVENLSGYSLDDVSVHYNSDKPAEIQAHAYAQGTDIHVASGQEKHLPHEAWHIIQQKQGRVNATMQTKKGDMINNDASLENEADVMGAKSLQLLINNPSTAGETKQLKDGGSGSKSPIQRTIQHVNMVAAKYNKVVGHIPPIGPYGGFGGVAADFRNNIITRGQFDKMKRAFALEPDGKSLPRNHQGVEIAKLDLNDPAMIDAANRMAVLNANYPVHAAFMNRAILEITNRFGPDAVMEFWKGGHMVFNDGGAVYNALAGIANPIAALKPDGSIKTKTDFAGYTSTNFFGYSSSTQEQRGGSMMARRPGPYKETSHYGDLTQYANPNPPPQYGVDMPEAVLGHVLFGLTPTGDTFIQTEGAGFQNFSQGFSMHLAGFAALKISGTQTGMTGTSTLSEQGANPSDLREADDHTRDSIAKILDSII